MGTIGIPHFIRIPSLVGQRGKIFRVAADQKSLELTEAWRNIGRSATQTVNLANPGHTNETVLAIIPIAANILGPHGIIRVTTFFSMTGSTNTKTMRIRLGGLLGSEFWALPQSTATIIANVTKYDIFNRDATNSQIGQPAITNSGSGNQTTGFVTRAVDTTVAQDLAITAQLATGTETLRLEAYSVDILAGF